MSASSIALAHRAGARRGRRDDGRGSCSAACWARRGCRARAARRPRVPRRRRGLTPAPPAGRHVELERLVPHRPGLRPRASASVVVRCCPAKSLARASLGSTSTSCRTATAASSTSSVAGDPFACELRRELALRRTDAFKV